MKGQAKLILVIVLLILITIFALQNTANVNLDLIFTNVQVPLVLVILFSLLVGVIVGLVASATQANNRRIEVKGLTQRLDKEKELRAHETAERDRQIADLRAQLGQEEQQQRNTVTLTSDVVEP